MITHKRKPCQIREDRAKTSHRVLSKPDSFVETNSKSSEEFEPLFFSQLEAYIKREMSSLSFDPSYHPHQLQQAKQFMLDGKLQVYREALGWIMKRFPMFSNVLQQIRSAYDAALGIRDERIQDMDMLKTSLLCLEATADEKMEAVRRKGRKDVDHLVKEKIRLRQRIDYLRSERDSQKTIITKLRQELTVEHERLINEIDSRRLLLVDLSQLRQELDFVRLKPMTAKPAETSTEDPVMLRLALAKCREDLSATTRRLNEMAASYTQVVPRRDWEALVETHASTLRENEGLKDLVTTMQTDKKAKRALQQRLDRLETANTPRSDWSSCGELVKGGAGRWAELTKDKTSEEKLVILLTELTREDRSDDDEYMVGLGRGAEVPPYLRFDGRVKNRRLALRDVSILVADIWRARGTPDTDVPLTDFLAEFFKQRYHNPLLRAEWAYNVVASCKKYSHHFQIGLLLGVLNGSIQEEVYRHLTNMHRNLIPVPEFTNVLRTIFPNKQDADITSLVEAAVKQLSSQPGADNNVLELFQESEEGFGRELARQQANEKTEVREYSPDKYLHA